MQDEDYAQITVATFDRYAERYAEKYCHLKLYDSHLRRFIDRLDQGARVLDMACGPGNVSAYIARRRPDIVLTGIDLAENMLVQARKRVPSAQFRLADCRNISRLGQQYDAAAFAFGLNYLTNADAQQCFASLNASLAGRGILYLSTITGDPAASGLESSRQGEGVYMQYRTEEEIIELLERAGYAVDYRQMLPSPDNAPVETQDLVVIAQRRQQETI